MASHTGEHPRATRSLRRPAQAIVLGCCVLAFACISSATAKPDHGTGKPNHEHPSQGPPAAGEEGNAKGNTDTNAAPEEAAASHSQRAEGSEGKPGRGHNGGSKRHEHGSSAGGESAEEPAASHVPPGQAKKAKQAQASTGQAVAPAGAPSAVIAAAPPAAAVHPSTAASPSAAPPPSATTTQSTATPQPQPARATRQAVSRSPRGARHARGRGGAKKGPATGASATGRLASTSAIATAPKRAGPARRARSTSQSRPAGRLQPLVTTITKIVGVVPTPIRVLIGVLLALALALGIRSRLVALRVRRLDRQRRQLLEDVGLLQAALLPVPPARLGPVATSAAYHPADGPGAGGDFYDMFALDDGRLAVIVGDISGHGRQALPHTALVRFTLRAYLEAGLSPRGAVQTAGTVLERALGGSFATVVAATYQPRDRILVYACAGHPPPIVLGSQALATRTAGGSPPIGAGMRAGTRQTVVSVPGFSQVCFHTDGVTDARVGSELYGAGRLARTLAELAPGAGATALLDRVAEQTDARPDDMAACLLRIEGGAAAPAVLVEELELDGEQAAGDRTERFLLACGVKRDEIAPLMRSARAVAGRGSVLLEVRFDGGHPEVLLQRDNVASLQPRRARPPTALTVSR